MKRLIAVLFVLSVIGPALAQDVTEPKSGVKFAVKDGDSSLLGAGCEQKPC